MARFEDALALPLEATVQAVCWICGWQGTWQEGPTVGEDAVAEFDLHLPAERHQQALAEEAERAP